MLGIPPIRKMATAMLTEKDSGLRKNVALWEHSIQQKGVISERPNVGSMRHYLPLLKSRKEPHGEMKVRNWWVYE